MFISLYQIGRIDLSIIKLLLRDGISMIYWGLGDDYNGHLRIGIPWFLISLFWSKLIIDVLSVYFKKQDVFYCLHRYDGSMYLLVWTFLFYRAQFQLYCREGGRKCGDHRFL